jgi:glycerol-3-phosphate dehydrogenase
MKRTISELSEREFDILVVGGGASGAATAREGALRGFKTALIERDDFGGGTSAHCFKVVHGGIRYLQHADIKRLRSSCMERAALLRIAPHLVSPMPFAIPTFGKGKGSKWFLGTGMLLYDALSRDCNALVQDPARRIRGTRFLARTETLSLFPQIDARGLTGAAIFDDGQMYNPPRLVLAFVAGAEELGARVANYVEAESFLFSGTSVAGVTARDRLSGERFEIRARVVINAAGPWAEGLLDKQDRTHVAPGTYSRDAYFLISRHPETAMALALQGRTLDADALLARSARHLFLVPWRQSTLVGVWHSVVTRDPDGVDLSRAELSQYIDEINLSHPALQVDPSEVRIVGFGLVPFGEASKQGTGALSFGKQSRVIDHRAEHGIGGLLSSISVRYTVARRDAAAVLDMASLQLGERTSGAQSMTRPLPGGEIEDFSAFLTNVQNAWPQWLPRSATESLARNYGVKTQAILKLGENDARLRRCLPGSHVSHAEVLYTLQQEMATCMSDVVFRRTELGTAGHPGAAALDELQHFMQQELGWLEHRTAQERAIVERHLERYLAGDNFPLAMAQELKRPQVFRDTHA